MANSVDPDQTAPVGAVYSGSTLFASIFNPKSTNRNKSCRLFSSAGMFKKPLWQTV